MKAPSLDDRTFAYALAAFLALMGLLGLLLGDGPSAAAGLVLAALTLAAGRGWLK